MATLNFPDNPDTGDTYSDGNSGFEYEWNGTVWISKESATRGNIQEIDDISPAFDGSTTDFTLNVVVEPLNEPEILSNSLILGIVEGSLLIHTVPFHS